MARTMKPKNDALAKAPHGASVVAPSKSTTSDIRFAKLQSELLFFQNRNKLLERDVLMLRGALQLHAPSNGAVLPSQKELKRLMAASQSAASNQSHAPSLSTETKESIDAEARASIYAETRASIDAERARIHALEKQIHALQGVMRSPPVRLARVFSSFGRHVKRALRDRKRERA